MEKVKLMCSYGGKINHRNQDRKLVYVGGHIKILTVDRNINFTNLIAKLASLCEYNSEIKVKYKLPGQDLDALISVFDDDDVDNMLIEADFLRRSSPTPPRLRLFVFPVTVTTPVTARSVNPDFLFGFDKEYSLSYATAVNNGENTETVLSPLVNAGGPVQIHEIPAKFSENNTVTRGSYVYNPTPIVYGAPITSNGYFQAGQVNGGGNREQPVVYGFIPGGNRDQPVVYNFIPVIPLGTQEQPNIPMSGSPLSYDAVRGEVQQPTVMMGATSMSNHDSKVANGSQHEPA